ncbi:MAG: nucleotidyltransferase family protein, partial [Clostridia bacterium]|nr:nucleotidyltransferase family protein [Clostridia bacterium]
MATTKQTCGLICEYNPFHFGHAYQIEKLKERFDTVVCILGGNVSQRGEAAVSDRYLRARAALENGADLVVELPAPWCCASAGEFAAGGVFLAQALGVDSLAFSAESDPALLYAAAGERKEGEAAIRALMKEEKNLSYPAAAERVLGKTLAGKPNDILGIEYLSHAGDLPAYILKRESSFLSSTTIRGSENPLEKLPPASREVFGADPTFPRNTAAVGKYLLALLRNDPPKAAYGVTEELYARMTEQAWKHTDFPTFVQACTNKMYTAARVRRAAWALAFGFPEDLRDKRPPYTLLLAANEKGRAFLRTTAKTRTLPV